MTTNAGSSLAHWFFVSARRAAGAARGVAVSARRDRQRHAQPCAARTFMVRGVPVAASGRDACTGRTSATHNARAKLQARCSGALQRRTHTTAGDTQRYSICQKVNSRSICRHWPGARQRGGSAQAWARSRPPAHTHALSGCGAGTAAGSAACCGSQAAAWATSRATPTPSPHAAGQRLRLRAQGRQLQVAQEVLWEVRKRAARTDEGCVDARPEREQSCPQAGLACGALGHLGGARRLAWRGWPAAAGSAL
jgi:hypothetical protein